jgi:predicted ATPase
LAIACSVPAEMLARRVAISGGPGGGKSTVAAALHREFGERVIVVPEVATHLLGGFFPSIDGPDDRRAVQRAIYHVQENLEAVHRARVAEDGVLVFDRGILDGAAYWPDGADAFFEKVCGDAQQARERYDAVVFLESAAQGGLAIDGGNPARTEQRREAVRLDSLLYELWSPHPRFCFVGHSESFETKVESALAVLRVLIGSAGVVG